MRHLFNALKEHWQIYVGLLLGLIIGLLVGVGFADWKSLVKAFDSKVTDWIMSLCTIGILIGTWKAASYAKKAAHQARIQNNNVIVSKIDDIESCLMWKINDITFLVISIDRLCKEIIERKYMLIDPINEIQEKITEISSKFQDIDIYKHKLFLINNIIKFKKFNKLIQFFKKIEHINKDIIYSKMFSSVETREREEIARTLLKQIDIYLKLTKHLEESLNKKYKELNGSS